MQSIAVLLALALVLVAARFSRHLTPVRALFPSWRFFDRAVRSPQLYVRVGASADRLSAWAPIELGRRSVVAFAFAPAANLALAYQSSIDRLVVELCDLPLDEAECEVESDPRVTELASYRIVDRIARALAPCAAFVQWKILVPEVPGDYLVAAVAERAA